MKKHSLLIHGMAFILCLSILYGPDKIQAQKTSLVRVHENVRETPYPQSIHQVYLNPTPLLLPQSAHEKGALYQFEMSMDKTFPVGKTLTGEPKPWITFNPHQILDKGTWYWRYLKRQESASLEPGIRLPNQRRRAAVHHPDIRRVLQEPSQRLSATVLLPR